MKEPGENCEMGKGRDAAQLRLRASVSPKLAEVVGILIDSLIDRYRVIELRPVPTMEEVRESLYRQTPGSACRFRRGPDYIYLALPCIPVLVALSLDPGKQIWWVLLSFLLVWMCFKLFRHSMHRYEKLLRDNLDSSGVDQVLASGPDDVTRIVAFTPLLLRQITLGLPGRDLRSAVLLLAANLGWYLRAPSTYINWDRVLYAAQFPIMLAGISAAIAAWQQADVRSAMNMLFCATFPMAVASLFSYRRQLNLEYLIPYLRQRLEV